MIAFKNNIITVRHRFAQRLKFRNKYGYGVHSPFMFNLVMRILRGRDKEIDLFFLNKNLPSKNKKYNTMLLKLINYYKPEKITVRGEGYTEIVEYVNLVWPNKFKGFYDVKNCEFVYFLETKVITMEVSKIVILRRHSSVTEDICDFINTDEFKDGKLRVCIIVENINKNSFNHDLWLKLKRLTTVTVDMSKYGILLFDNNIQKGYYSLRL